MGSVNQTDRAQVQESSQKKPELVDLEAFSASQMASKLWLCREIEKIWKGEKISSLWILGGWYGLTALILALRERIEIGSICSIDKDPRVHRIADQLNKIYEIQDHRFKSYCADVEEIEYGDKDDNGMTAFGPGPQLVINTSCEHFSNRRWWERIIPGQTVALQMTDMSHEEHAVECKKLSDFKDLFPMSEIYYEGELSFGWPLPERLEAPRRDWPAQNFKRFMLIGKKSV